MQKNICLSAFLLSALVLSSCGFEPVYSKKSPGTSNSKVMAGVKIDHIAGRPGQEFKADLEDRLNPPSGVAKPTYRLHATLVITETPIGVSRDGTVSRYNMYLTSKYILYLVDGDKPITSGTLTYINSYNNLTNAYFSTYISEDDARTRGIAELSELYRERLGAYLDAGAPVQKITPIDERSTPVIAPFSITPDSDRDTSGKGPLQ